MCIFVDFTGPLHPVDMPKDVQVTEKCSSSNVSCDCSEGNHVQCEQKTGSQAYFTIATTRKKVAYNRLPFAPALMNENLLNPECFHPIALNQLKGFVDVPLHKYDTRDRRYYPEIYYNLYLYHYNLLKDGEIVSAIDLRRKAKQILKWQYPEANTFFHVRASWLAQYLRAVEKLNKEYHENHNITQCGPKESDEEYYCHCCCNTEKANTSKSTQSPQENFPASEVKDSNGNPLSQLNVVPEIDLLNLFSPRHEKTPQRENEFDTLQSCPQHSKIIRNKSSDLEKDRIKLFATSIRPTQSQSTSNSPTQFERKTYNTRVKSKNQFVPADSGEDLLNLFAPNVIKSNKRSRNDNEASTNFLPLPKRRTQNITYNDDSDSEEDSGNNSEFIESDEEIRIESEHENTSDYETEGEASDEEFVIDTDILKKIPKKSTESWKKIQLRLKKKKRIRQRNKKYFGKRKVNPVIVESVHEELFSLLSSRTDIFL